ncbi:MAG: FkbM family methyltransferase [Acetobacteraceae bacterium]|nr:FkbM family methyltransferase [Acetobacteraceae bacterium]
MGPFIIHHVGARFGNSPFPIPEQFTRDVEVVLFDADDDCVEGLLERDAAAGVRRRIVSTWLSDTDGEVEFRLTVNASASSLLEPSEASRGFVQPIFGIDWDVAGCATVIERRRLKASRLDTLLASRPDIPAPDFLSLDTQGSELAIIAGAANSIRESVIGLIVEVEFIDLDERVPRFGAIAGQLEAAGFHFAGFHDMIDAQASRQPIGRRSNGFPVAADALFLRRVDSVTGLARTDGL